MAHTIRLGDGGIVGRETAGGGYRLYEVGPAKVVYAALDEDGCPGGYRHATWAQHMPREVEEAAEDVMHDAHYRRLRAALSGYHDGQPACPWAGGWQHDGTGRCWLTLGWSSNGRDVVRPQSREFADTSEAERWLASEGVRLDAQGLYA